MRREFSKRRVRAGRAVCSILLSFGFLGCMQLSATGPSRAGSLESASTGALDTALQDFVSAIAETAAGVQADPAYADPQQRAAGALYWAQMVLSRIEADLIQEPDFPLFRVVDFRVREGADNPDQRYLFTPIRGEGTYRIWGKAGAERRIEVQVYAGLPWTPSGGRIVSALAAEDLKVDADGNFEIFVGGEERVRNFLPSAPNADMVMVRQIHGDWMGETGEVHIDRVGFEGRLKPSLTDEAMARRLETAALRLREVVPLWPYFGRARYSQEVPNTLTPLQDTSAGGGVVGRWMALGDFDLAEDEALVLTTWPAPGNYQGVQLTDLWTSSLEYGNRQTSLTGEQARLDSDGAYRFVISHEDPGVANWLDTTGLRRGYILLRYDGTGNAKIPEAHSPRLEKVRFDALGEALPADTPVFSPEERRREIEKRRRHVQKRFGV
ncbi:MAG: hypothetical protein AB8G23_20110 [Myxococcota bacterium]